MKKGAIKFPIHYAPHRSGNVGALVASDAELICIMDSINQDEAECLVKMANAGAEKGAEGKVLLTVSHKLAKVLYELANTCQIEALLADDAGELDVKQLRSELAENGIKCSVSEAHLLSQELFDVTKGALKE